MSSKCLIRVLFIIIIIGICFHIMRSLQSDACRLSYAECSALKLLSCLKESRWKPFIFLNFRNMKSVTVKQQFSNPRIFKASIIDKLFSHKTGNVLMGMPCSRCDNINYQFVKKILSKYITNFILGDSLLISESRFNLWYVVNDVSRVYGMQPIILVVLESEFPKLEKILPGFDVIYIKNIEAGFKLEFDEHHTIIFLCCGPFSLILACTWYRWYPGITCVCADHLFESQFHKSISPSTICSECNPI